MIKKKNGWFIIVIVSIICGSCRRSHQKTVDNNSNFSSAATGVELDRRLHKLDSLVFVFYKDPYGRDSLRYTRYYTQFNTTDNNHISILLHNLGQTFTKLEKVKNCRGEGKVWCYAGGKIFQTIYFSTRCDQCCFLYLIKDGYFFYMNPDASLLKMLTSIKPKTVEPMGQ